MERCEKGKPELLDQMRSARTKGGGYMERPIADKHFCVPLSTPIVDPVDLKSSAQLTQAQLEKYSRAYDDSPHVSYHRTWGRLVSRYVRVASSRCSNVGRFSRYSQRETDEYSSCFDGSDSALSSHLTKEELEHYTRIYEEKSTSQISLSEKVATSHQHQTSYAQSEGYHSYVSSTDSTSTPFLDRYVNEWARVCS